MLLRLHHIERHLANNLHKQTRQIHNSLPCKMRIIPVPIRSDNYMYLLAEDSSSAGSKPQAFVIDPADPNALDKFQKVEPNVEIVGVLTTHHHEDHAGGNSIIVRVLFPLWSMDD